MFVALLITIALVALTTVIHYEVLGAQNGMLMVTASGTAVKLG